MPKTLPALLLLVLCLILPVASTSVEAAPTDDEIEAAIVRMQNWLMDRQDEAIGRWDKKVPTEAEMKGMPEHERARTNGETVMATYALLSSGWSPQEPRLNKALRYLRENDPWGTYGISVRTHIWASLPDSYLPNLQKDAEWLLKAQSGGLWNYGVVRGNRVDHSTSQYGILGLWEFTKRGGRTPDKVWQDALTHYMAVQGKQGGWAYSRNSDEEASGSMTAAGLTVLYIAVQQLYGDGEVPAPVRESIARGHAWLDKHFSATKNPLPGSKSGDRGHLWYYLYGIERVALASGVKTFAGHDWFEEGAATILKAERGRGTVGSVIDTSFALMFLARGRVPVWINKISLPNADWNNRPNDIYEFTRYLSDLRESELNWQVVGVDLDALHWSNAPVAWLSSDDKVDLTDAQLQNLKKYLEFGGLLVANAESRAFTESIRAHARTLFPDLAFKPIEVDHPALTMLTVANPATARKVLSLNNGVRDLILLLGDDWGRDLQNAQESADSEAVKVMTNLYGMVTERGSLDNRLVHRIEPRSSRSRKGTITVARARYDSEQWDVEPHAWEPLKNVLFNRTGYELEMIDAPLDKIDASKADLVHLAGVEPVQLSDAQKQALKRYVEKGGTVLIETIGGRGEFSLNLEDQLRTTLGGEALPLPSYSPIISGQGLEGGQRVNPAYFRQYSLLYMAAKGDARLAAFNVGDRPAVIVSHDDLSLGAMGVKRWGINGYQSKTARELLVNILLSAAKSSKP